MEGTLDTIMAILLLIIPIALSIIVIVYIVKPYVTTIKFNYISEFNYVYLFSLFNQESYPTVTKPYVTQNGVDLMTSSTDIKMKRLIERGGFQYYEYYSVNFRDLNTNGEEYIVSFPNEYYMVDMASVTSLILGSETMGYTFLKRRLGLVGSPFVVYFEYMGSFPYTKIGKTELQEFVDSFSNGYLVLDPNFVRYVSDININGYQGSSDYNSFNELFKPYIVSSVVLRKSYTLYNAKSGIITYEKGFPSIIDLRSGLTISSFMKYTLKTNKKTIALEKPTNYGFYDLENSVIIGTTDILTIGMSYEATLYNRGLFNTLNNVIEPYGMFRISLSYKSPLTITNSEKPHVDIISYFVPKGTENASRIDLIRAQVKAKKITVNEYFNILGLGEAVVDESGFIERPVFTLFIIPDEYIPDYSLYHPKEIKVFVRLFDMLTESYTIKLSNYDMRPLPTQTIDIDLSKFVGGSNEQDRFKKFYELISKYNGIVPIDITITYEYDYMGTPYYTVINKKFIYKPQVQVLFNDPDFKNEVLIGSLKNIYYKIKLDKVIDTMGSVVNCLT